MVSFVLKTRYSHVIVGYFGVNSSLNIYDMVVVYLFFILFHNFFVLLFENLLENKKQAMFNSL